MPDSNATIETTADVEVFRNIRYATSERFEKPELLRWDGARNTERGPICPQAPSRLESVQGPMASLRQSEDCQVLSVFTPDTCRKRPVMVFFHGGAFVTGGGELPWYDGHKLAAEQDVVIVSASYRLGVFGYYHLPTSDGPSSGMADQVMALRWVQANIASLGGDPENVTVFGQSAGGFSIVAMLAWGYGGTLFRRAILQSGANGAARIRGEADRIGQMFLTELGQDPRRARVDDIIAAQSRLAARLDQLIVWGAISPDAPARCNVDVIAGWCKNDALPFVLLQNHVAAAPGSDVIFSKATSDMNVLFEGGSRSLAQDVRIAGNSSWLYRFDWSSPQSGLGACHCIELPFLLGSADAWRSAPALGSTDWDTIEPIGRKLRQMWADFAREGHPDIKWSSNTVRLLPM